MSKTVEGRLLIEGRKTKIEATEDHIYGRYKRAGNGEGHQLDTNLH